MGEVNKYLVEAIVSIRIPIMLIEAKDRDEAVTTTWEYAYKHIKVSKPLCIDNIEVDVNRHE